MAQNNSNYTPHDTARLLSAQTYKGRYVPRQWFQIALGDGWSVDDVCSIIQTPCSILSRMANDLECDYVCRVVARSECEIRRAHQLPPDGYSCVIPAVKNRRKQPISDVFSNEDKTEGKYVGFRDLIVSNTANRVDIMRHIERIGRDIAIKEQSARIAQRLENNGIPAYRKNPQTLVKRGLLTRLVCDIPRPFNNIMFIPAVAVAARSRLRKELKFWIENESDKRSPLRYLVVTGGKNVRFGDDLKAAHRMMCRRISETFKVLEAKYGAKLFVRVTEHTINQMSLSLNLHFNILYSVPHLRNGGFQSFLRDLHDGVGCFVKDAGAIKNVDEVVKYVCKPSEIEALEDQDLCWLHDELKNTRLYQTYSTFKDFRSGLNKSRHRIVFDSSAKKLRLMKKRVVNDSSLFDEIERKTPERDVPEDFNREVFMSLLASRNIMSDDATAGADEYPHTHEEENKIVGLMLPHAAFFNVTEPCLLIRNYTENPQTDIGIKALELIADMEKSLRLLVRDKLGRVGCNALSSANYDALRVFYRTGNRDINQADSYILDTLHDISHEPDPPPRRYRPARPPNPIVSRVSRVPA